jgi:hypothetical protein
MASRTAGEDETAHSGCSGYGSPEVTGGRDRRELNLQEVLLRTYDSADVSKDMLVMNEETFGPVVGVMTCGSLGSYRVPTQLLRSSCVYTDLHGGRFPGAGGRERGFNNVDGIINALRGGRAGGMNTAAKGRKHFHLKHPGHLQSRLNMNE